VASTTQHLSQRPGVADRLAMAVVRAEDDEDDDVPT
jgi:hypothetical protein